MSDDLVLQVERVGARGDGIATWQGEPVYLPLTAPGDRVRAKLGPRRDRGRSGTVIALIETGARQIPPCPHFGTCGGCALQHLSEAAYAETKAQLVRDALAHRGLNPAVVEPLRHLPAAVRRRARLALRRPPSGTVRAGFHARASHEVVDLQSCAVLEPALVRLISPLRRFTQELLKPRENGAAIMTSSNRGIDLLLDLDSLGVGGLHPLGLAAHAKLLLLAGRAYNDAPDLPRHWRVSAIWRRHHCGCIKSRMTIGRTLCRQLKRLGVMASLEL